MKKKHFLWLRAVILILGLVIGIVLKLNSVETWKAFLTSFCVTVYLELLALVWELKDTQEMLSRFERAYPFLIPASIKSIWQYADKHPVFTNWILRHVDLAEAKLSDLQSGVYKVQTHLDIQDVVELYEDAFTQSPSYGAIGDEEHMLRYFLTANGKEFLRRLRTFQQNGKLKTVRRIVILRNSDRDTRLAAFIRLHHRFGWEVWTVSQISLAEILPEFLRLRVGVDALDAGLYGDSYVCEASPAAYEGSISRLLWVHDGDRVRAWQKFFRELLGAAVQEMPAAGSSTPKGSFEEVYAEFRKACTSATTSQSG